MVRRSYQFLLIIIAIPLAGRGSARGAFTPAHEFATTVAQYTQGTVASYDTGYGDVADWTGIPTGTTGADEGDFGVVTPFFPPFDPDQILLIGTGGELSLKFPKPVRVGSGPVLGIFTTAGFIDANGQGTVGPTAATFGGGFATVKVSGDGIHWTSLGNQNLNVPQSYYRNSGPYDVIPPAQEQLSDYGKPYTGGMSAFDNQSDAQVIATLNGSAGGTWLNLSGMGLSQVSYIDFTPPSNASANWQLALEAVSSINPVQVPEPVGGLLISVAILIRRVRRS